MTPSTTSKELSERLKALGVKQDSYFTWVDANGSTELRDKTRNDLIKTMHESVVHVHETVYAAFTAGELGEMLPMDAHLKEFRTVSKGWGVELDPIEDTNIYADNEAQVRGLYLEYLLTNGLLQADTMV